MKYSFHPEAETEFEAAISYYESCQSTLGYDFSIEVYTTIQNILTHPKAWPSLEGAIRRCQTRRFPYGVVYSIEDREIYILAVMHPSIVIQIIGKIDFNRRKIILFGFAELYTIWLTTIPKKYSFSIYPYLRLRQLPLS